MRTNFLIKMSVTSVFGCAVLMAYGIAMTPSFRQESPGFIIHGPSHTIMHKFVLEEMALTKIQDRYVPHKTLHLDLLKKYNVTDLVALCPKLFSDEICEGMCVKSFVLPEEKTDLSYDLVFKFCSLIEQYSGKSFAVYGPAGNSNMYTLLVCLGIKGRIDYLNNQALNEHGGCLEKLKEELDQERENQDARLKLCQEIVNFICSKIFTSSQEFELLAEEQWEFIRSFCEHQLNFSYLLGVISYKPSNDCSPRVNRCYRKTSSSQTTQTK